MKQENEKIYNSKLWLIFISLSVSLGTASYAFQANAMNDALKSLLIVYEISEEWKGFISGCLTSSMYLGASIGASIGLLLVNKSMRKNIFLLDFLIIVGSIVQVTGGLYFMLIGRVISGIGSGMNTIFIPIYIKQFSPKTIRSLTGSLYLTIFGLGYLVTLLYGITLETPKGATKNDISMLKLRLYFLVPQIFSLVRIILLFTTVKFETPIYYYKKNQQEELKRLLEKIYKKDYINDVLDELNYTMTEGKRGRKGKSYYLRFKLALFLCALGQLGGLWAILQYSTTLFMDTTNERISLILTFMISIIKTVQYSFMGPIIQKYGRRKPYLIGNGLITSSLIFISIAYLIVDQVQNSTKTIIQYIIILMIYVYMIGQFCSITYLNSIYVAEITDEKGFSKAFILFWLLSVFVLQVFPIVIQHIGIIYCFGFFAFVSLIGQYVIYKYVLETANKNQQEIDETFNQLIKKSRVKQLNSVETDSVNLSLATN